jgi:hypothetical protein
MDPIRHPSRLILVKGPSSPLYVFENDNVVVWASEHSIIKDTWGDLVGTPPKPDKIRFVGEGKFLMADDYKALEVHEFKVKPRPIIQRPPVERQNGYAWIRGGRTPAPAASFRRPWDTNGLFNSINDYKKAVADFRANPPEGFKLARRWDLRESYDDKVDFADVKGNLKWPSCMCGHGILGEDMTTHLKYGTICKDCYRVCHQEWQKDSGSKREEDPIEGITLPSVDAGDWENLENWAEIESKLHRYTLTELSDQTGLSQRSIDFLMYRTGTKSQDFGIGMTGLKFALLKAYEKLNEEIVTNYWNEITAEVEAEQSTTSEEAQELADQQMYPWTAFTEEVAGQKKRLMYICEEHNEQFPYGDHCASCVWAPTESCGVEILKREPDNVHPLNPTLQRCKDCGGFYLAGVGCIPCAAEEVKGEVEATIKVTETACCCKGTRNRACKKPISLVVENALVGKQKGYCGSHWDKCGASKCNAPANFTGLDGYRFCHTHCRGRQGIADVAAYRDGSVVIVEVK